MEKLHLDVINNNTCFIAHEKHVVKCERKKCPQWIKNEGDLNCVLIAARKGPKTLSEIGNIYGLTRMRICQIEKKIYDKIKSIKID